MPTEQQIRDLAYSLWEQEGHPDGKDQEHYYRARQILEEQERAGVVKLAPPAPVPRLAAAPVSPRLKAATRDTGARKTGPRKNPARKRTRKGS